MHPVIVDGRTLVLIRRTTFGYAVVESGELEYDGKNLQFAGTNRRREITDAELRSFQTVTPENRIATCRGFDFFVLVDAPPT
jgi:hypothetical protein